MEEPETEAEEELEGDESEAQESETRGLLPEEPEASEVPEIEPESGETL